jgi:hypothetical protein
VFALGGADKIQPFFSLLCVMLFDGREHEDAGNEEQYHPKLCSLDSDAARS